MQFNRSIVVHFADIHGGHKAALLNPNTKLPNVGDEPGVYCPALTSEQLYLDRLYYNDLDFVESLAAGDDIHVILDGDVCQGNKYKDELVTSRLADQVLIAAEVCRPWFKLPNLRSFRFALGTGAHVFGEGSAEILLAEILSKEFTRTEISATYHGLWNLDGCKIDYAHHGPSSGWRSWTSGNQARLYLKDILRKAVDFDFEIPDLVLRAHVHDPVAEAVNLRVADEFHFAWIFIAPSYSLIGDYARKAVKSPFIVTNGMFVYEVVNGSLYRTHPLMHSKDIRTIQSYTGEGNPPVETAGILDILH